VQVGLNFDDVRMAVLVQRVVPARYAFVIHTRNPSNNDETEVRCSWFGLVGLRTRECVCSWVVS
jgi:phosphoenolpyruvate synthase/pyruvate phosphate dikinase